MNHPYSVHSYRFRRYMGHFLITAGSECGGEGLGCVEPIEEGTDDDHHSIDAWCPICIVLGNG